MLMSVQQLSTAVQQLTAEVAQAYKVASERAEFQIRVISNEREILTQQLANMKKQETAFRTELTEVRAQLAALSEKNTPSVTEITDNV